MTEDQYKKFLTFMGRVELKGIEANSFQEVINTVTKLYKDQNKENIAK